MPNRRTFLMTALGTVAVGAVALITGRLRRTDLQPMQGTAPEPTLISTLSLPTEPAQATDEHPAPTAASTAAPDPTPAISGSCPPPIIARADWGALPPNLQASGEHGLYNALTNTDGWLVYDQSLADILTTIIVHHSALPLDNGPREIQALHMHDKGFADVGYHFIIDDQGQLYEGRDINVRGAHTYAHNYGTIGICLVGNFEIIQPSPAQIVMLRELIQCLLAQYPNIGRTAGHRDYNPTMTVCPGNHLAELLPDLAKEQNLLYGA